MTLSGTMALPASCFRLLPDKLMVRMIMELVRNQSFNLTTCDNKQSKLRRPKSSVFQGSVFAALLCNFYTYNLPSTISRKLTYANNLALLHNSSKNWKVFEGTFPLKIETPLEIES